MKIKTENGTKWVSCDNLGEVINEFKKFRTSEIEKGRKRDYNDYLFLTGLRFKGERVGDQWRLPIDKRLSSTPVYQKDRIDLSLNLAQFNLKEKDWIPYQQKIRKILKEIWETGEVKDYQGLDLNWPVVSDMVRCDQCHQPIGSQELAWFSDRAKDLDFCSESCYSQFKENHDPTKKENRELKEQLKQATNQKIIWRAAGIISLLLAVLFFVLWFRKKRKNK